MVPILKMRRFSCLLRLSLPPEMGEMAQIFISEIEWLAALKCRATVIPHRDGLEALKFFLNKRTILEPSTTTLIRLAELVLTTFVSTTDNLDNF